MKGEILGGGCPKCEPLARYVEVASRELGTEAARGTDVVEIASRGVLLTPVLSVDGETASAGRPMTVLERKQLPTGTAWPAGRAVSGPAKGPLGGPVTSRVPAERDWQARRHRLRCP